MKIEELLSKIVELNEKMLNDLLEIKKNITVSEKIIIDKTNNLQKNIEEINKIKDSINIFLKENNYKNLKEYIDVIEDNQKQNLLSIYEKFKEVSVNLDKETNLVMSLIKIEINTLNKYKENIAKNLKLKV